ncbi:cilia- and flagella-associated protein 161-like [Anoplophora glabripennis]|uniref:cilia- and flagella-associated protein 161-like n=1 Tax=Anoplophora glabripennis TaxID=217634 RepID=UPI000873F803|nr:cilia- and flagella-associated protein 161-like [Anoplophora glabripennis]
MMHCSSRDREKEEQEQVYQNRIIYSLPVRLGLWNEELALWEERNFITAYKKEHCQLLVQKTKKMFRNVLKTTILAPETPYLLYNQNYQIVTSDIVSSEGNTGLYLSGVLNERDIDYIQHFQHGCALSASPIKEPCVRNTFKIIGCDSNKRDQPIIYGEDVYIQISESGTRPLYIQCENSTIDTFGGHLSLKLSQCPDIYCRFKFLHWDPKRRYQTTGTNFKPNSRVIIKHTASGKLLAAEQSKWMPSFYGPECVVSCHTYKDGHKMETAENFWKVLSSPPSNKAMFVRAAKGEDVPSELYS